MRVKVVFKRCHPCHPRIFKMAPLLGRKPYPLAKPLAEPPGPGEEVYIVEHTKEAFRNKEYP